MFYATTIWPTYTNLCPPSKRHKGRSLLTPNAVECIEIAKTFKPSIYIAEISSRLEDYTNVFLDQISNLDVTEFPTFFFDETSVAKPQKTDDTEMHQSGHLLLKFSCQLQKSNAIRYKINLLRCCLGIYHMNVIKGASKAMSFCSFLSRPLKGATHG